MIGKSISHFKILDKIGAGGMGVVYRAHDTTLERDVALKFLPTDLLEDNEANIRFRNEAKTASALDHPNICTIYEIGEHEGQSYIAMGLVEGETLEQRLKEGPLSLEQTVEVARQIARGLEVAHEKDIVHRDLKPSNIMIDKHGVVKIMDFGLAKRKGTTKVTKSGSTIGTLAYMSPEQVQGAEVDSRADLWSLGVILLEMLTGETPFSGVYEASLIYEILNEQPKGFETLHGISPPLLRLIENLLDKEREHRTARAAEVLDKLKQVSSGEVSLVRCDPQVRRPAMSEAPFTTRLVRELSRRRFLPIVGSYTALAIGLLQVGPYLFGQFEMDPRWHQVLLIWVLLGFPLAILITFFHGRPGPDRVSRLEAILLSVVLVAATGLSGWSWQTSSSRPYKASADTLFDDVPSIAVMYFEDPGGAEELKWLSKGLPHMLITALEQSSQLRVVGYQRLYDILKEIGKENVERIDRTTATEIAQRAGVKTMLLGSIFKWNNLIRVDYQLQDVTDGSLRHADKVSDEDPFALADKLAEQVRQNLEIPSATAATQSVAEFTTHSLEAYRYYIQGKEFLGGSAWKDAGTVFPGQSALTALSLWPISDWQAQPLMQGKHGQRRIPC